MAPTRERVRLSVDKKYHIIQMIDKGESQRTIARKHGISRAAVASIISGREKITKFYKASSASTSSHTIVLGENGSLANFHRTLRQWYIECTENNINVTNAMLKNKAQDLNEQFCTNYSFKGSLRWVTRFKERYDFHEGDINEDLGASTQYEADIFTAEFRELLQDGEYTLDNVYNADSAALMWKALPEKTLLFEKLRSKRKMGGGQVTTLLCANATGCHKLPAVVIGTIENFPNINSSHTSLPSIMNTTNTKPYMNSNILKKWFNECFLKFVTERQQKYGQRKKTLLLLHNGCSDHENRMISTNDDFVKIMYYSYNAAPLIQPMDRGIIACFQRMYRNELLETLRSTSNTISEEELIDTYTKLNINDCCRIVQNAWIKVKNPILKNAWDKLLKDESEQSSEDSEIIKKDIDEALAKLNKLPGCEGCDSIAVMNWFETDKEYNTDTEEDIQDILLDFINSAMDTKTNEFSDENFDDILDDSSP